MTEELHLWADIAAVMAIVGVATYLTCLSSTTFRRD